MSPVKASHGFSTRCLFHVGTQTEVVDTQEDGKSTTDSVSQGDDVGHTEVSDEREVSFVIGVGLEGGTLLLFLGDGSSLMDGRECKRSTWVGVGEKVRGVHQTYLAREGFRVLVTQLRHLLRHGGVVVVFGWLRWVQLPDVRVHTGVDVQYSLELVDKSKANRSDVESQVLESHRNVKEARFSFHQKRHKGKRVTNER
jgi:hypothetical protein